jgi:hypothetical protein
VDLGFPLRDGALFGPGVQGYLSAVAGDAEVGVLDVDGQDLPGVGGSDVKSRWRVAMMTSVRGRRDTSRSPSIPPAAYLAFRFLVLTGLLPNGLQIAA